MCYTKIVKNLKGKNVCKTMLKKTSIYLMHKYWGKKPSDELEQIISKFSNAGDTIFDPFSGFGGFAVEGVLQNRNVIINDLNPIATFISKNILNEIVDIKKLKKMINVLKLKYEDFRKEWYSFENGEIITILRDSEDKPLKLRVKIANKLQDFTLTTEDQKKFLEKEQNYNIKTWFPKNKLIHNSRISAKVGMTNADLFPKRALICQSFLFDLICNLTDGPEKELLKFTFTSNLANCSKLVPPIISRGDMSQGAWMTGFHIGKTYLENNVFHYFENRLTKTIKGKECYLQLRKEKNVQSTYKILNEDAKKLSLKDNSIDFVFTDFPYGDTVPYFEQSQLWNHWLKNTVDYENEIVVSDSSEREKNIVDFKKGIDKSISEISRVLKYKKYFVFTFHSLAGEEWSAIVSSLKKYGFKFQDCEVLLQKTLPPRQLNRCNTIKGDIIAIYQKNEDFIDNNCDFENTLKGKTNALETNRLFDTNELVVLCIKSMLETSFDNDIDFKTIIGKYFVYEERSGKWRKV